MGVPVGNQLAALAGLFGQSPINTQGFFVQDGVSASFELLQMALARNTIDKSFATAGVNANGFWTANGGINLTVPPGRMWCVTGMTVTCAPNVDNATFAACIANSQGLPILVAFTVSSNAAGPVSGISGSSMFPTPFFLKAGDQIGVWVVAPNPPGGLAVYTITARLYEFPSY